MIRHGKLLAIALLGMLLTGPAALAQSTATSSSSVGSSTSSSFSLDSSNVLAALALGAGGRRGGFDRAILATLFDDPIMGDDQCVDLVRLARGGFLTRGRGIDDDSRYLLAHAIIAGGGTLTQDALANAFAGERERIVLVSCPGPRPSDVFFNECLRTGRDCDEALVIRLLLDADGLDETEKRQALSAAHRHFR